MLADAVRRALGNDMFLPLYRLDATLTTGEPRPNAEAIADTLVLHPVDVAIGPGLAEAKRTQFRGEVALWFGDFAVARDLFERATRQHQTSVEEAVPFPGFHQQLVAAEEMGDEAKARDVLRTYVARRGDAQGDWDPQALSAMRLHRALPDAEIERLRGRWRQDVARIPGYTAFWQWLSFDAAWAMTAQEARAALAMSAASSQVPASMGIDDQAMLGRVLLLAGRPADAAPHLEQAALACVIFRNYAPYAPSGFVTRAAFDLGEAREALGDRAGACDAYRRVLARWGESKPRSVTADRARARMKSLLCAG
jgi:hypothetical protein